MKSMKPRQGRFPRMAGTLLSMSVAFAGCSGPSATSTPSSAPSGETVRSSDGMVSSANLIASEVGARVLDSGGNAIDAAIATGLALAVVHPTAGNIGGGGFMIIRLQDGRSTAIDFREKAPLAANPEMFVDEHGEYSFDLHHNSYRSVGVPGTVAGFAMAHERYGGGLPWADLVAPAIELAGEGLVARDGASASDARRRERLSRASAASDDLSHARIT